MKINELSRLIIRWILSLIVIPVAAILLSTITLIRVSLSIILAIIAMILIGSWGIILATYLWSINGNPREITDLFDAIICIADLGDVQLFRGIPRMWKYNFYYELIKGV